MTGRALSALTVRELRLAVRIGGSALLGTLFFLIVVTVVPFAVGPDLKLLARLGPAFLWIGALLASLLSIDRLFQADTDDGSLDLLMLSSTPLELVVLVKCLVHWLTTGLPLVVAAPVLGLLLDMDGMQLLSVTGTLLIGTPALTMIGAVGAALTASLRRGGLLLAVIVLPVTIPVLVFGVSAAAAATGGTVPALTPFLVLGALTLASLALAPFAAAAALRVGLE
ncbi:MAG: heme exporter protein CcmB [Rhodobiaceae bacterium]|nr:heme exporter protein CcmB [Rhodobiaceae bacterium]MCC0055533.1 heme exporter protein CcmB [Rhodobiaceae bacterium]